MQRTRFVGLLASALVAAAAPCSGVVAQATAPAEPSEAGAHAELKALYRKLIDAENLHDLASVRAMLLDSPSSLFISRLAPVSKGDWGGYWGTESVVHHFADLYKGVFRIDPDYSQEKEVLLTPDVAEAYVPVVITSSYGGQAAAARHFIMVLVWIKTPSGWKVATDVPMPIPPAPTVAH